MTPFLKSTRSVWIGLGALSIIFHLWLIFSGLVPNLVSRPLHMALVIPWVFLFKPSVGLWRVCDWGFTLVGIAACFWIVANHNLLLDQYGYLANDFQTVIALILLITVLDRKSVV